MAQAFIGFGGNIGDVLCAFGKARSQLTKRCGKVWKSSALYRTRPLLPPHMGDLSRTQPAASAQPDYLNAACALETHLDPKSLLAALQQIEVEAGRQRSTLWAPRTLDLDILTYDALVFADSSLVLPHPHLRTRIFVLRPLVDIAADFSLPPDGLSPRTLLAQHDAPNEGIAWVAAHW